MTRKKIILGVAFLLYIFVGTEIFFRVIDNYPAGFIIVGILSFLITLLIIIGYSVYRQITR